MPRYQAQVGGMFGSGVYPPRQGGINVDVAGLADTVAQALAGRRDGLIRQAMMQREFARQDAADKQAAEDRAYLRQRQDAQDAAAAENTAYERQRQAKQDDMAEAKQANEEAARRAELGIVPDQYAPAPGTSLVSSFSAPSIRSAYMSGGSQVGQFQRPDAPAPSVGSIAPMQLVGGFTDPTLGTKYREKEALHTQARADKADDMATALRNAKELAAFQAGLRAKNAKAGQGKLGGQSDFSRKADFMLPGAIHAVETINAWEDRNHGNAPSPAGVISRTLGVAGNYTTPEDLQVLGQSAEVLADAYLRLTTGASINAEEKANAVKQMLPAPGDKPAVLKQKRERRRMVLDALTRAAAPTTAHEPDALAPQPQEPAVDFISHYGLEP